MYTDKQIKEHLLKEVMDDVEVLEVIRRMIFDIKKVDVGQIQRPQNDLQLALFARLQQNSYFFYKSLLY